MFTGCFLGCFYGKGFTMSNVDAIKKFFSENSRPVTFAELKALTPDDRAELGGACATALGETIDAPAKTAA